MGVEGGPFRDLFRKGLPIIRSCGTIGIHMLLTPVGSGYGAYTSSYVSRGSSCKDVNYSQNYLDNEWTWVPIRD